jgi:hypothetical protein
LRKLVARSSNGFDNWGKIQCIWVPMGPIHAPNTARDTSFHSTGQNNLIWDKKITICKFPTFERMSEYFFNETWELTVITTLSPGQKYTGEIRRSHQPSGCAMQKNHLMAPLAAAQTLYSIYGQIEHPSLAWALNSSIYLIQH